MPWVGFEPTILAGERPKTYALDRTATGTGASGTFAQLNYFPLITYGIFSHAFQPQSCHRRKRYLASRVI